MTSPENGKHSQLISWLEERILEAHPDALIFKETQYQDKINGTHGEMDLLAYIGNTYLLFEMKCNGHEEKAKDQLKRARDYLKTQHKDSKIYMFYVHGAENGYAIKRIT